MKIAMPHNEGRVNERFGSSKEFIIVETENGAIKSKKVLYNETETNYGGLVQSLKAEGVEVVVAGGIGRPMAEALHYTGFNVIMGITGDVEKVVEEFLAGQLVSRQTTCACGGFHDHENH